MVAGGAIVRGASSLEALLRHRRGAGAGGGGSSEGRGPVARSGNKAVSHIPSLAERHQTIIIISFYMQTIKSFFNFVVYDMIVTDNYKHIPLCVNIY